jgi:Leucine-rich repeat (LRR) protein
MRAAMRDAVKQQKGNRKKAKDSKARWKEANKAKRKVRSLLALAVVAPLSLVCLLYPLHSMGYFRLWKPSELSRALSDPKQAENLDLTHQYLESVPDEIGTLVNLKVLVLDQNEIPELTEAIFKCEELESLSVQYNKIKSIPADIKKTDRLRSLNVAGNAITELPPEVSELRLLETLNIADNAITSLPDDIDKFKDLRTLNIKNNNISSLPENLSKLSKLETLNLANNKITSIPDLTGMPNLKSVVVRGTGLSPAEIDSLKATLIERNVVITR